MSSFDTVVFDDVSNAKIQVLKGGYKQSESVLLGLVDSREKLYAISRLEESFMWAKRAVEREQSDRHLAFIVAPPQPSYALQGSLSPEAAVLAEGNEKMKDLINSFKDLTSMVAANGGIISPK